MCLKCDYFDYFIMFYEVVFLFYLSLSGLDIIMLVDIVLSVLSLSTVWHFLWVSVVMICFLVWLINKCSEFKQLISNICVRSDVVFVDPMHLYKLNIIYLVTTKISFQICSIFIGSRIYPKNASNCSLRFIGLKSLHRSENRGHDKPCWVLLMIRQSGTGNSGVMQ